MFFGSGREFGRDGFCTIRKDMDRQPKCNGCRRIEALARYCNEHLPAGSRPKLVIFHKGYRELDFCAEKCSTCRVVRRGFLLNQATFAQAEELAAPAHQVPVWVTIEHGELRVSLQEGYAHAVCPPNKMAAILLGESVSIGARSLPTIASEDRACAEIQTWARDCQNQHPDCGNLNWSRRNPTRLIHIMSDSMIKIVETRDLEFLQYVALSYCWGAYQATSNNEVVAETRTVKANIAQRTHPFPISDLRKTIQDVMLLMRRVGLRYVWVDSVCIIQDSAEDWSTEASLMAEVYSNSYFTICSVAVEHADAALIRPWEAWKYPSEPCELDGRLLSVQNLPLDELKRGAPYSNRAWILQEEKLSPRITYWTPQRMYWSCATKRRAEGDQLQKRKPEAFGERNPSHAFLRASREGVNMHTYWRDIVEDYTRRLLTNTTDRFPALSGLAAKFQLAQDDDEYLAGLWRNTIAEDLAWRVDPPASRSRLQDQIEGIPSWSWASLPTGTSAKVSRNWIPCDSFVFLESQIGEQDLATFHGVDEDTPMDRAIQKIRRGAHVTSIAVRGRIRPLLRATSERRSWADVSSCAGSHETFSFASFVDRNVHCIEPRGGRLLVYESQRRETVFQLDYLSDADEVLPRIDQLECLELGAHAMLLVEKCGGVEDEPVKLYRRFGVALGLTRLDFFIAATLEVCHLI